MPKSDKLKVVKGMYKGAVGYIQRRNKNSIRFVLAEPFDQADSCEECNDEDGDCYGDHEALYEGDTITISPSSVVGSRESEILMLNEEISKAALSLRGLVLRKKMLEDPKVAEKEVEKILSCLEEASD